MRGSFVRINADLTSLIRGVTAINRRQQAVGRELPKPGAGLASVFEQPDSAVVEPHDGAAASAESDDSKQEDVTRVQGPSLAEVRKAREMLFEAIEAGPENLQKYDALVTALSDLTGALFPSATTPQDASVDYNQQQVDTLSVVRLDSGGALKIEGEIVAAAQAATLAIEGGANEKFTATASFTLTGAVGTRQFNVAAGDTLASAADSINDAVDATGVQAAVVGDDLLVTSVDRGSQAKVEFELIASVAEQQITGVNSSQIANVTANQHAGESVVLTGSFTADAAGAEVRYLADSDGNVAGSATFDLVGPVGAASFSIAAGESLVDVADRINGRTGVTGIKASIDGDELVLTTESVGASATVAVNNIVRETVTTVGQVKGTQFTDVSVQATPSLGAFAINGDIVSAAGAAELFLQTDNGAVANDATIQVTGGLGAANFQLIEGESLSDVANRINAESQNTGVTANVDNNVLTFASNDVGSSASVEVDLLAIDSVSSADGVNATQITTFMVNSVAGNGVQTLDGTIDSAASLANLTYQGVAGAAVAPATFNLTGELGSTAISVSALESLSSIRDKVNAETSNTGVGAIAIANELYLVATGYGSNGVVEVEVTSGTFDVTGGNGDGTASGVDATATINGQSITANGNAFSYADASGSFSFDVKAGFTGPIDTVTVTTVDGEFDLTGGNGDGEAAGTNATAVLNGQSLTADSNGVFAVDDSGLQVQLTVNASYLGEIDTIAITAAESEFDLAGGLAVDQGTDAAAVVNGQNLTSANRTFIFSDSTGDYTIEFADGFLGALDPITVATTAGELDAANNGLAHGTDATGVFNGVALTADDADFTFADGGVELQFTVVQGFSGPIDPIAVSDQAALATEAPEEADSSDASVELSTGQHDVLVSTFNDLASRPENLDDRADALLSALSTLSAVESSLLHAEINGATINELPEAVDDEDQFQQAVIVSQSFRQLVEANPQIAADAFGPRELGPQQILDLLG